MKENSTAWIMVGFFLELIFYGVEYWLLWKISNSWYIALLGMWVLMDLGKVVTNLNRIANALEEKDE